MQTQKLIVSSPDILGGTPVFAGTRVPIKNLTDYIEAGELQVLAALISRPNARMH